MIIIKQQLEETTTQPVKQWVTVVNVLIVANVFVWMIGLFLWLSTSDVPPIRRDDFVMAVDVAAPIVQETQDFELDEALKLGEVDFSIESQSALLINLDTGEFLFNYNGDVRMYPASVTKIMTVLIGIEYATSDDIVVMANFPALSEAGASMAGFVNHEMRTLSEILHGSLLSSGADATSSIAYHVAGSYPNFVALMNETARRLGMTNTHFMNASGLHHENHFTTAYDTALLLQYALSNPDFREIFTTPRYEFVDFFGTPQTMYSTFYRLAPTLNVRGGEILGGKTGFTTPAGLSLASIATDGFYEFALITFGAPANGMIPHITDAFAIYDYFFNLD